jgi:glycosyltransferase involved in cell wall biosynthesis
VSARAGKKDPFEVGLERHVFGQLAKQVSGLSDAHLDLCLEQQRLEGGRIGEILLGRDLISRDQLAEVLRRQAHWIATALRGHLAPRSFPYPAFLSVCLPAYNEEANIRDTVMAACAILPEFVQRFEVVVVDDGCKDQTAAIVLALAALDPRIRLVQHEQNRGYGAAVATGLRAARGELVFFMDSDGQFSLLDMGQLLCKLRSNDAVIGYRYARADSLRRKLMAWGWGKLIGVVVGVRVYDLDCAFKLFRRELIDRIRLTTSSPAINAEILLQCRQVGARIAQTPVQHFPRYHGVAAGCGLRMITRAFRELPRLVKARLAGHLPPPAEAPRGPLVDPLLVAHEERLRICMLAPTPFPANQGTPGSIREMAEGVSARGHEVHIVTYHIGQDIPVKGPQVHRIGPLRLEKAVFVGPTKSRPWYDLKMIFKTLAVIRKHRPHLLHAHGYEAALIGWVCRLLTGVPLVYSGHNTMADELASYHFIRPQWLCRALARFLDAVVPRLGNRVLPHSPNMDRFFRERVQPGRIEPVVPFGISLEAMTGSPADGAAVRRQYGLEGKPVVLYAGLMDEFQRLDLLLEAMVGVARAEPEARLLLVVTIPNDRHRANFLARAEKLGVADKVILTEPQPLEAVPRFLQAADVAVVPRPQVPGFPIKLINYMAARRPCVLFASSAGHLRHGRDALLAGEDTGAALGEAIVKVLREPALRQRLARNGHRFVREHHDRRLVARQVCDAYAHALGGPGPADFMAPAVDLLRAWEAVDLLSAWEEAEARLHGASGNGQRAKEVQDQLAGAAKG